MNADRVSTVPWQICCLLARGLMEAHCREFNIRDLDEYIGPHQPILDAERDGNVDFTLAECGETAVGYLYWAIGPHPSLYGQRVARMGPWHIAPQARGGSLALRMFRHSLDSLRRKKADCALATMPLRRPDTLRESGWLRKLHGRPFEVTWMIPLFPSPL